MIIIVIHVMINIIIIIIKYCYCNYFYYYYYYLYYYNTKIRYNIYFITGWNSPPEFSKFWHHTQGSD